MKGGPIWVGSLGTAEIENGTPYEYIIAQKNGFDLKGATDEGKCYYIEN